MASWYIGRACLYRRDGRVERVDVDRQVDVLSRLCATQFLRRQRLDLLAPEDVHAALFGELDVVTDRVQPRIPY